MSHFTSTKRSRRVTRPSKSLKISHMDQSRPSSYYQHHRIQSEDDHQNDIDMSEDCSTIHHHPSKRPRLSYNKRLQANARERERVHNLTAAFEALRQVIPTYYCQSRLSRLSVLRIACSYVLVLGALNEIDFSEGQNSYTLNESFHLLSSTILNEVKHKKPNNDNHD